MAETLPHAPVERPGKSSGRLALIANAVWEDLKRRNVIRAGAATVGVMGTISTVAGKLKIPLGHEPLFWILFFVAIVIFEWFYDIENGTIRRTPTATGPTVIDWRAWWKGFAKMLGVGAVLAVFGLFLYSSLNLVHRARSLTVRTFVGDQVAADSFGFAFGIVEGIGKKTRYNVRPVVRDTVGAEFAVEGRFVNDPDGLKVVASLVDLRGHDTIPLGEHPVAASASDPKSLRAQDEIVRRVAKRLHYGIPLPAWITGNRNDPRAQYEWRVAQGRFRLEQWSIVSLDTAQHIFERLRHENPGLAEGYAGVAYASALLALIAGEPEQRFSLADTMADEALARNSASVEALLARGIVRLYRDLKPSQARAAFREAAIRAPGHAAARYWYGRYLTAARDTAGARKELTEALRLHPRSLAVRAGVGEMEFYSRQYAAAERVLEDIVFNNACQFAGHAQYPLPQAYLYLARSVAAQGRYDDAEAIYELALDRCQRSPGTPSRGKAGPRVLGSNPADTGCSPRHRTWEILRAQTVAGQGDVAAADSIIRCVQTTYAGNFPAYEIAIYHSSHPRASARDSTLTLLDQAIDGHIRSRDASAVVFWRIDPAFAGILGDQKAHTMIAKYTRRR